MSKPLCKTKKPRKARQSGPKSDGRVTTYVCRGCYRVANKKKKLCKPAKAPK